MSLDEGWKSGQSYSATVAMGLPRLLLASLFGALAAGCSTGTEEGASAESLSDRTLAVTGLSAGAGRHDDRLHILRTESEYQDYFGTPSAGVDFGRYWVLHYSAKPQFGVAILGAEIRWGRLDLRTLSLPLDCAAENQVRADDTVLLEHQPAEVMPHVETRTLVAHACSAE